jgi:predicted methyltransferase
VRRNWSNPCCLGAAALFASLVFLAVPALSGSGESEIAARLTKVVAGDHRADDNKARDRYRHPVETLAWLGMKPDMTVVELSPGGGWYTEILAPYLRKEGKLYAAGFNPESEVEYRRKGAKRYADKLAANPEIYDKIEVTILEPPDKLEIAPAGSADMIVTFRNFHGWMDGSDKVDTILRAIFRTLKPGGVFALVQHRGNSSTPQDPKAESGYVNQDHVIALVKKAGFEFVASSEINANSADDADHPEGVWTLPPSLALEDKDREKYLAIGESDRMTLKFRRPASS